MAETRTEKPDFVELLAQVPHKAGIYIMRDRLGRVIYIGKARDLRRRLASYFHPGKVRRADTKTRALINSIWSFETRIARNETEALLWESRMIKEHRPRYNILLRDDKRFVLVKMRLGDPMPRFEFTRVEKGDGANYFGPFTNSRAARLAVDFANKKFALRACSAFEPSEKEYKHCHADMLRNCSAPCVGKISLTEYRQRAEEASDFLRRAPSQEIENLRVRMAELAERKDFEGAAKLRDLLEALIFLRTPTRKFKRGSLLEASEQSKDEAKNATVALRDALTLPNLPRVIECFDISNISSTHIVASMARFEDALPCKSLYRRYRIRGKQTQDDFASMAEVVRRRYTRLLAQFGEFGQEKGDDETVLAFARRLSARRNGLVRLPDLVIVDGGKGQLSAACKELQLLGLWDMNIIGLAKEREEIFMPGESEPLRIDHSATELKLLQRVRDEAHRFANAYHQILMRRRIRESVLEEFPGISSTRKEKLLRRFGSLKRLKSAPVSEVAECIGFGEEKAEKLLRFLKAEG